MSIVDELHEVAEGVGDDLERAGREALGHLQQHVQRHPQPVFALLRTVKPILHIKNLLVVTRFADVRDVLSRNDEFTVEPYAPKMRDITGDFILGLDDDPQYEHDVSVLRLASRQDDLPRIGEIVGREADALVSAAAGEGQIDAVAGLTVQVPTRLVGQYFGVPGPSQGALTRWAHTLFEEIFLNLKNDPAVHQEAMDQAGEFRPYLDSLVAERKAAHDGAGTDDVLGRLLELQGVPEVRFSDVEIRSNLIGLITGLIPTTSKATALALDELLRRPEELERAQQAARDDDDALLASSISEAMRLNPQAPGLVRRSAVDTKLGEGTHHETDVPKGTLVFASTQSAMLDGDVLDDPDDFKLDRPPHHYLHYGLGLHTCFGRHINALQIPRIAKALLRQPRIERAGELEWDERERFPRSLRLRLG